MPESIHTNDESKRGSVFAFIFGVNWLWHCGVTALFGVLSHEMKCNETTSFTEFPQKQIWRAGSLTHHILAGNYTWTNVNPMGPCLSHCTCKVLPCIQNGNSIWPPLQVVGKQQAVGKPWQAVRSESCWNIHSSLLKRATLSHGQSFCCSGLKSWIWSADLDDLDG